MKKGYKKTKVAYTWDNPHRRIDSELGITLYKHPQHKSGSINESPYPRYKYKVTFEYIGSCRIPNDAQSQFRKGLIRGYEMGFKEGNSKKKKKLRSLTHH